jgi:hypothetical protein
MFKKIEPLENSKHRELRFSKAQGFGFAKNISAVQLSFSELRFVSRFYPIIFPADGGCIPQALLSLEAGKNLFVDDNGNWKVSYIPAYFRQYPFTLVKIKKEEDKYALCLDPDAEHFSSGQGEPLFTADGESNEFVQNILNFLKLYQQELATTENLFKKLNEKELIVEKKISFEINHKKKSIDGFKGVDMKKLISLDDKSIAEIVRTGTMGFVYEHLQSLSNIAFLAKSK